MYRILSVFYSEAAEDILLLVIVSKIKIAIITCRRKALYLAGNLDFGTNWNYIRFIRKNNMPEKHGCLICIQIGLFQMI